MNGPDGHHPDSDDLGYEEGELQSRAPMERLGLGQATVGGLPRKPPDPTPTSDEYTSTGQLDPIPIGTRSRPVTHVEETPDEQDSAETTQQGHAAASGSYMLSLLAEWGRSASRAEGEPTPRATGVVVVEWGRPIERTAPPDAVDQSADEVTIVVVDCRGVLIGEGGMQYNDLVYRISTPVLNLEQVLVRPDVQNAFQHLMTDPENPAAWDAVEAALTSGPVPALFASPPDAADLGPIADRSGITPRTTVLVLGSRGVQTGPGGVQRTRFVYSVSPTLDAATMLARQPALARSLIDHIMLDLPTTDATLIRGLGAAIQEAVTDAAEHRTDSGIRMNMPPPGQLLRITALDAAAIGAGQQNTVRAELPHATRDLSGLLSGAVRRTVPDQRRAPHRIRTPRRGGPASKLRRQQPPGRGGIGR